MVLLWCFLSTTSPHCHCVAASICAPSPQSSLCWLQLFFKKGITVLLLYHPVHSGVIVTSSVPLVPRPALAFPKNGLSVFPHCHHSLVLGYLLWGMESLYKGCRFSSAQVRLQFYVKEVTFYIATVNAHFLWANHFLTTLWHISAFVCAIGVYLKSD